MKRNLVLLFVCSLFVSAVAAQEADVTSIPEPSLAPNGTIYIEEVEKMPMFGKDGERELLQYVSANIKYPREARKKNVQGTVYVAFVIDKQGRVSTPKILRGIGSGCDEEVLRMLSSMPAWQPGTKNGKPVMVQYNLPVKFSLKKSKWWSD